MSSFTGMETVTIVDMIVIKPDIENVYVVGIGQAAVLPIFLQDIPQDRVVYVSYLCMEGFSADAVDSVACINVVRILAGIVTDTVIRRTIQKILTGNERPNEITARKIRTFGLPEPVDCRNTGDVEMSVFGFLRSH